MRVFLTGASGFIGSAIAAELLGAGHQVLGLARSDTSAQAIAAAGAEVHRGDLADPEGLGAAAASCDGVIHTAFVHDFTNIEESGKIDLRAVEAMGAALAGSDRPFVMTTGTALLAPGRIATERDGYDPSGLASYRARSEHEALALAGRGVRTSVVRPTPTVHGKGDHGFVPMIIDGARSAGYAPYIGEGTNRWPAVHRLDAARLYRLALESAPPGSVLHAVGEEGIPMRGVAEVIAGHLAVPARSAGYEEVAEHIPAFLAGFLALDVPASSAITRELLGWEPTQPGLIEDLEEGHYFAPAAVGV